MWPQKPSEEDDDEDAWRSPEPGPIKYIEPGGRDLTRRARDREAERAALERWAAEIYKSIIAYGRNLKWERPRDE